MIFIIAVSLPPFVLSVGEKIKVKILKYDRERERVSLGLKQMADNPWADIEAKFPIGQQVKGKITKLLPYGA